MGTQPWMAGVDGTLLTAPRPGPQGHRGGPGQRCPFLAAGLLGSPEACHVPQLGEMLRALSRLKPTLRLHPVCVPSPASWGGGRLRAPGCCPQGVGGSRGRDLGHTQVRAAAAHCSPGLGNPGKVLVHAPGGAVGPLWQVVVLLLPQQRVLGG